MKKPKTKKLTFFKRTIMLKNALAMMGYSYYENWTIAEQIYITTIWTH